MHNPEQQKGGFMSPRISFSNDFVESQQLRNSTREKTEVPQQPVSSDFEFSVGSDSMMSADELFYKGKLLPFKQSQLHIAATTLRDELLHDEDDEGGAMAAYSTRPPKGSSMKWKGILGLRKKTSHSKSSKSPKGDFYGGSSNGQDTDMDS